MRTTLTLDPDIAQRLKEIAHRKHKSFKEVVNETLLAGLDPGNSSQSSGRQFKVKPRQLGFRPGIDQGKLNQLSDELESDDFASEATEG